MAEELEDRLMDILAQHRGEENAIGMGELYKEVFRRLYGHRINDTSELRQMLRRLRRQPKGALICSTSSKRNPGYYLATTPAELTASYERQMDRAMATLTQANAQRKTGLALLQGQRNLIGG